MVKWHFAWKMCQCVLACAVSVNLIYSILLYILYINHFIIAKLMAPSIYESYIENDRTLICGS